MSFKTAPSVTDEDVDPTPPYEDSVIDFRAPGLPARLNVVSATWGGVNVTEDIRSMVMADETLALDMVNIYCVLMPDPVFGVQKTLSVLYQYEGADGELCVLNAPEQGPARMLNIYPTAHKLSATEHIRALARPWTAGPHGEVEILAVLYGPDRIETPSVLNELARFFEGRRGQIRMTNAFFKADPWPNHRKSWTVYFRFLDSKKIQCVTGMEDGALEVPWSRTY
ncbi:hypothetical protein B0T26DRAFT_649624 [Lasiosphaeria miniovina]|uniref:Uncharacterized protein n=1 Tax=Lasiosphaeria miniovina TaxID=1954250 RepID=A0AA40DRY2_9PEZI|nr:uncharacterized protein B0T26DRAFT_649624 [Lasiosphaeria miniovina]KAK0713959.1 hypothetical protein B0T26DRAFT_649624 [Lasiosphaeria miniovina]